jgi:rare lipoprotein A
MRRVFALLPAAVVLSVFGALPAAADFTEDVRKMGEPYRASQTTARQVQKQRYARATSIEAEREYDVRPSLADDDDDAGQRVVRPRRSKSARPATSQRRTVRSGSQRSVQKSTRGSRQAQRQGRTRVAALPGGHQFSTVASYYQSGHTTASGARYNPDGLTAAHRTLPFGTRVRVTHMGTGRSVHVTINDRGPFIGGRAIDLSRGAARVIGMIGSGLARVSVEVLGR